MKDPTEFDFLFPCPEHDKFDKIWKEKYSALIGTVSIKTELVSFFRKELLQEKVSSSGYLLYSKSDNGIQ